MTDTQGDEPTTIAPAEMKTSMENVQIFMLEHNLDENGLREVLREYRSETGWSPFEYSDPESLGADFLGWYRWERLG